MKKIGFGMLVILLGVTVALSACSQSVDQGQNNGGAVTMWTKNDTGKTLIKLITKYKPGSHHSYMFISKDGTVAISDPNEIPDNSIDTDIVTISHRHSDHLDHDFLEVTDAKISSMEEETITVGDITVTGIGAQHHGPPYLDEYTNYIHIFEIDGLRIGDFGDMGQDELTPEQLEQIGNLDIMITNFSALSNFGFSTEKTLQYIDQVKPKIIMPGHSEPQAINDILYELGVTERVETAAFAVDRADIDALQSMKYVYLN